MEDGMDNDEAEKIGKNGDLIRYTALEQTSGNESAYFILAVARIVAKNY